MKKENSAPGAWVHGGRVTDVTEEEVALIMSSGIPLSCLYYAGKVELFEFCW